MLLTIVVVVVAAVVLRGEEGEAERKGEEREEKFG